MSELTQRETQVLRMTARGSRSAAIAARLNIAEATVDAHMQNARIKLGAQTRAHAVALGIERGYIGVGS